MPVALPLLVPMALIFSAMAVVALHHTENMWLRPLLEALAHPHGSFFKRLALKVARLAVKGVYYVERHVRAALSHWAYAHLAVLTRFFGGMAALFSGLGREVGAIAHDVADALSYLRHHTIPHLIHAAVRPVDQLAHHALHDARRSISLVHRAERDFTRGIDRLRHSLESWVLHRLHGIDRLVRQGVIPRLRTAERAIGHVVTRDLPAIRARERAIADRLARDGARLTRLEKALGAGVLVGLIVRTLVRRFPWLFCRTWKRIGPRVCSMHTGLLDFLLGVGGAMFLLAELCQFVEQVASVAARVLPKLIGTVAVAGAALCNGEHTAAPALPLELTQLPNVPNPLPLD